VKTSREERNLPVTKTAGGRWNEALGNRCRACASGPLSANRKHSNVVDTEECTDMDWRHRALCRDEDPELFFPIGTTGPATVQVEQAKAVCRRCSVVESCLDWALRSGQDSGVWGGLSEDERRALKRRQSRTRVRA
jgi:WhiB family transcriptional regulator, redox-sensing transcriptional regulator